MGCALADARLAFMMKYGRQSIKIDRVKAEEHRIRSISSSDSLIWLSAMADRLPAAQFVLATCYYNNIAVENNDELAFSWCLRAANADLPVAQNLLGNMYVSGRGVDKDNTAALDWYSRASRQNEPSAIFNLGTMYEQGAGVGRSISTAMGWFKRAAGLGSLNAHNMLGIYLENNAVLDPHSAQDCVEHYKVAAQMGHPHAQYNLARLHIFT